MREVSVDLKEILHSLEGNEDILKLAAAAYANSEYGVDSCDLSADLEEIEDFIDNDSTDLLTNIQNTFANVDNYYDDGSNEDEDEDYDDDNYEEDEEEDDYWDNDGYEDDDEEDFEDEDDETQRLIEENRRKNEEALGL